MKIVVVGVRGRIGSRLVTMLTRDDGISEVPPGSVLLFGDVPGSTVTCPLHGAQFNVWTGAALRGQAKDPLKIYTATVDGDVGHVDVPLAQAVQGACRC